MTIINKKIKILFCFACFLSTLTLANELQKAEKAFQHADYKTAFTLYKKLAGNGDGVAQIRLADMYSSGKGADKDDNKAFDLYLMAAKQEILEAQWIVAVMYTTGVGVKKDDEKSFKWFLNSAGHGYIDSQAALWQCYLNGKGTEKNYIEAYKWLLISFNDARPKSNRDKAGASLISTMTITQLAEGKKRALDWMKAHNVKYDDLSDAEWCHKDQIKLDKNRSQIAKKIGQSDSVSLKAMNAKDFYKLVLDHHNKCPSNQVSPLYP